MRNATSKGFTLIEVLTALALSGILVAALGSVIFGAFQVMRALDDRKKAVLESSLIALEKMSQEVQSSPVFPGIAFKGEASGLSFPKLVQSSGSLQGALSAEFKLGKIQTVSSAQDDFKKIEYYFDASRAVLVRQSGEDEGAVLLENVSNVIFSYLISPLDDEDWEWKDRTPGSGTEAKIGAIRVQIFWNREAAYTIPGIEKTFIVFRHHPVNSMRAARE